MPGQVLDPVFVKDRPPAYVALDRGEVFERGAVEQHRVANDRLTAARLLENKLDAVDEAIEELSSGWPHAPQAPRRPT